MEIGCSAAKILMQYIKKKTYIAKVTEKRKKIGIYKGKCKT